jgi:chaperonin GroES
MNLKPLGDRLIVEVLEEEEQTFSGIVLPDTAKEKPQRGRVLAVGPGSRDDNGKHVPMDVVEDDEIVFSKYGGTEIKVGTEEYLILRESDVLAKVVGTAGKKASKSRETAGAKS